MAVNKATDLSRQNRLGKASQARRLGGLGRLNRLRRLKGGFAVEALGALALLTLLVGYSIHNSVSDNHKNLAEVAATHHKAVAKGASLYVRDNYSDLLSELEGTNVKEVTVKDLQDQGYLSTSLSRQNPWGQELKLKLKKGPESNPIEALVVSQGGQPVDVKTARQVAERIGAEGGYTVANGEHCGSQQVSGNKLCGTNHVWEYPSGDFGLANQNTGYIASALFFKDGMQLSEYLYRKPIPGKDELTTMETYLRMGEGAIAEEGGQCDNNMKAIAMSNEGLILSCQNGSHGKEWVGAGSTPEGMYAFFHATECPSGWTLADGQNGTLDMRGKFVRGVGGNSAELGEVQGDAIRNITGSFHLGRRGGADGASGAFTRRSNANAASSAGSRYSAAKWVEFDASQVVPTADENRPVNIALLACKSN